MMEEVFTADHLAQERSEAQFDVDAMKIAWAWLQARLPCRRPLGSSRRQRSGFSKGQQADAWTQGVVQEHSEKKQPMN